MSKRVVVVTDSTADLPAPLIKELDIRIVPILLNLGGKTYRDGVDLTPPAFYRLLRASPTIPKTSSPSVGDFLRVYAQAAEEGSGVVAIHLAAELSAVYKTAALASQLIDTAPIRVIDSRCAAMAQGLVVLEAARAASSGADLSEVVARAKDLSHKVRLLAVLETLDYLHRGGRIGNAAHLVGATLRIKPVLTVHQGKVELVAVPRTKIQAFRRIVQEIERQAHGQAIHAGIFHSDAGGEAQALRERLTQRVKCAELHITEFTPVMGAHTGPGVVGVAYYVSDSH